MKSSGGGDGFFRVPLENQTHHHEFHFMGSSWVPTTPRKPMQGSSSSVIDERVIHRGEASGGYGVVQDLNYAVQGMDHQNGVYDHQGVTNANVYASARRNVVPVIRSANGNVEQVNGNFTSDAGVGSTSFPQSGDSQARYSEFELDDLLNPEQMPFSFTSLLSGGNSLFQVPQYEAPACSRPLYDLNSPPRREAVESVCESSVQAVPSTPSLRRTVQENGFLENIITTTGNETTEKRSGKSIVDSSVVNSTEVVEQNDGNREIDLDFDLNQTPQQKLPKKRKKFMPKVIKEGKPKRKPPKPASQENAKAKEPGSDKKKKAPKKNLKESATNKSAIVGDMNKKSCRKVLNFDLEKPGDARQGDSESEIAQNASGSNSFSETRDATGGTSGRFLDSVTQNVQTNGLVSTSLPLEGSMGNQPVEAPAGAKLPRVSQENHTRILARDQQPELLNGNQQCQFPTVTQNAQHQMGNQQAWLQMENQPIGFPFGNQQPHMAMGNQQSRLAMCNQQSHMTMGNQQPRLAMGNQQPLYLMGASRPAQGSGNQACLPAGNRQYGSPSGLQQLVMSTGGQRHGLPMNNQQYLLRNQQREFLMRNQQPESSMRGRSSCVPLMNQQPGSRKDFPLLNQMLGTSMSSPGLHPHPQSQTQATNLHVESFSRNLNGTAGTRQRSNIPGYGTLQQILHQRNEYTPYQERSNPESLDVLKKALSQSSSLPSPSIAKHVEARGSKRLYDCAMGQLQNHYMNPVGRWPFPQQIAQSQDVERQNIRTCGEYLDAARKMKIQKACHENLHGMPPEVIEIEDDPTDEARKDKNTASINETGSKGIPCLVQDSADNMKCIVPKTPGRKGPAGRKKLIPPVAHALEIEVYEPPRTKTSSSKSKGKEKERKSKQDSAKAKGSSGEFLWQDSIAEIIYRLEKLNLGENIREQDQNALVLYRRDGAVVPYEVKKRKPRPKVDLDDETTRIWNLLMGKGEQEGDEEMDKKKEKWWEEERRVFRGRADSFIARMHLVQGDRRFSPWKGSVVDSVIGVFLTQNVTDHLSSSAFMSLAARFPPKPSSNREDERNTKSVVVEDPEGCILNLNDIPSWEENVQNPSDTQGSGVVDSGSKEQQRNCSNSGIERFSFSENSSQNLDESVLSSQDSFDPATFQSFGRVGSCSGSKSEHGSPNLSDDNYLLGNERPPLYDGSGDVQVQETANVAQKKRVVEQTTNWKDSLSFGQPSNDTNWQKGPTNPFSSYEQSTVCQPDVPDIEDFGMPGEGMGYSWLSISPRVNKNPPRKVVRKGGSFARESIGQLPKTSMDLVNTSEEGLTGQSSTTQNIMNDLLRNRTAEDVVDPRNNDTSSQNILVESNSSNEEHAAVEYIETNATIVREIKGTVADGKKPTSQWDSLRTDVMRNQGKKERSKDSMDSIDYEAIRNASISEISEAIKERGMNNMLAVRIKDFLERIVKDHGAVDLEWLRDVPPEKAKDYLLSIRGLGLKSVECVRLLTLHNLAFPVDTNVGRIAVRLGWVPLQPLPESLQLHLLELYPVLESIQKFLWPRLCKLDQRTLYELHYQLITFGKVFCTKSRPNCNACPMRGECRHFASAYASARLSLPAPDERSLASATIPVPPQSIPPTRVPMMELPPPMEQALTRETPSKGRNCEPIIEMPGSPEQECTEITESDIEDAYYNEDPDEIPTIKLNIEEFGMNLRNYMERNMELQEGDMSKALVSLNPTTTCIPTPKLKNISRLRTEHQVYEIPDSHILLDGMDKREPDDPSPYLLAIWTPGETANSAQPPEQKCGGQASGKMCFEETCSECNSVREANAQTVRGTLLIPCRTAMRGSFPLNGTYFQVNELFADHDSSLKPIDVPRDWIWNLPRRTVYFGTSVTSIFRGLSTEQIQHCFWRGFVCVRGFEQKTRAPRPLMARLHFPASKLKNNKPQRSTA